MKMVKRAGLSKEALNPGILSSVSMISQWHDKSLLRSFSETRDFSPVKGDFLPFPDVDNVPRMRGRKSTKRLRVCKEASQTGPREAVCHFTTRNSMMAWHPNQIHLVLMC